MLILNMKYGLKPLIIVNFLVIFFLFTDIYAQNLVPNFNFDSVTTCPDSRGQVEFAPPWYSPNFETTDLMHTCSTSDRTSIPDNFWGNQFPASGRGMVGIRAYLAPEAAGRDNYKEYIAVELIDSLIEGESYFLSFKVSPGEKNVYITDDVGMYITDTSPRDINLLNVTPIIENIQNRLLSNYASWVEINGNYVAKGGEKHVVIGNFKDNDNTTLASPSNEIEGTESAYLFVDEVVVEPCSSRLPDSLITNQESVICNGSTIELATNLEEKSELIWSNGSTATSIIVDEPGYYYVNATINGCVMEDSIEVIESGPEIMENPDTTICRGNQLFLTADNTASNLWNNEINSDTLLVDSPGTYFLSSTKDNCTVQDTIIVDFAELPDILDTDTIACIDAELTLDAGISSASYLWSTGESSELISVFESGIYSVQITTPCYNLNKRYFTIFTACGCGFFAPNAISLNNDGVNDQFEILVDNAVEALNLTIVNRWGEKVYTASNSAVWDITETGASPDSGTYFWEFTYRCFEGGETKVQQQSGFVKVLK